MRKSRKRLNLFKGSFDNEQPLNTTFMKYPLPTYESFDCGKLVNTVLDEPSMWKEATPEEAKAAKIAYEKWKVENKSPL